MSDRVAIYARVSADQQSVADQIHELREVGDQLGWRITNIFIDEGMAGAKGRDKRPAHGQLLKAIARNEIDLVATWTINHLAHSLYDLIKFLDKIREQDIHLYLHQQNMDTSSATYVI
ncbi:recombinase family protein [Magnetovibrio blakemorei]|nr:recombinase family protein [Magnetovibrio blakemorei]